MHNEKERKGERKKNETQSPNPIPLRSAVISVCLKKRGLRVNMMNDRALWFLI